MTDFREFSRQYDSQAATRLYELLRAKWPQMHRGTTVEFTPFWQVTVCVPAYFPPKPPLAVRRPPLSFPGRLQLALGILLNHEGLQNRAMQWELVPDPPVEEGRITLGLQTWQFIVPDRSFSPHPDTHYVIHCAYSPTNDTFYVHR